MNEKNLNVFIDFGSSKIRIGIFDKETTKNIFISEKECTSNFNLEKFEINNSNEVIKDLIQSAEKKIDKHIKNINLMIDTPGMFSIDISIKKKSDYKMNSKKDIQSLLKEAKSLIQKNYPKQKIIHMIVKKFVFDDKKYYEFPNKEINYYCLVAELKFICMPYQIWKNLHNIFNKNHITIDNLYCSSYVRSSSCNLIFDNFKKKIVLDIGFGKSSVAVFEEKRLLYFNILPIGGRHITNDISLLLKINRDEAEKLKKSLNKSEITFSNKTDIEKQSSDLSKEVIFARVDEIIKLNLADDYFNNFFTQKDNCVLIFIGEGSKILNKNSIYLEEKFDFFNEISFFEENTTSICESGYNFVERTKLQEVDFLSKKSKNKGFFEKIFYLFD